MATGLCFLPVVFSIVGPPRVGGPGTDLYAEDLPVVAPPTSSAASSAGKSTYANSLELVYGNERQ